MFSKNYLINYNTNLQLLFRVWTDLDQSKCFKKKKIETGSRNFQFPFETIHFICTSNQPIKTSISGISEKINLRKTNSIVSNWLHLLYSSYNQSFYNNLGHFTVPDYWCKTLFTDLILYCIHFFYKVNTIRLKLLRTICNLKFFCTSTARIYIFIFSNNFFH